MTLSAITPQDVKRLVDQGALLIDIREADEHARAHIPGARHVALSRLDSIEPGPLADSAVIFYCKSDMRTLGNAQRLAGWAGATRGSYALRGGLDAWRKSGLPVETDRHQPLELQRQVQIGAGSLALLGTMLGIFVSPWFLAIPAFVGAGLTVAGATGFCGMALMLRRMPWNRALAGDGAQS